MFRNRGAGGEETGLSGILDLKSGQSSKGSKLESALDKLGLQKRKVRFRLISFLPIHTRDKPFFDC